MRGVAEQFTNLIISLADEAVMCEFHVSLGFKSTLIPKLFIICYDSINRFNRSREIHFIGIFQIRAEFKTYLEL